MTTALDTAATETPGGSAAAPADLSAWPLEPAERTWGSWQLLIALATAGAATWCYMSGEAVGEYLNFKQGFAALTAGTLVGTLIMLVAALPTCCRFGIDSISGSIPQFGLRGWVIPATLQFASIIGWNSLLLIFFGKSSAQLLVALNLVEPGKAAYLVPSATVLACVLVFLVLLKGTGGIDRMSKILVAHVFVGLWMLYIIVSQRWTDLMTAVPPEASASHVWNMTTGFEVSLSAGLSWWAYIGAMVRMVPHGSKAAMPVLLGLGIPAPILSLIGVAGILVLRVSDPAEWLRTVGGPVYAIVALLFVTAANLGTTVAGVYVSAIGLQHYRLFERVSWPVLLAITLAPVAAVGIFLPDLVFNNIGTFLSVVGVMFAPLCGIQIVDYFVLRRRRISIRGIFAAAEDAPYQFWGGVNPAAVVGMLVGCAAYVWLLNPITFESHLPYQYISASIPTAIIAAATYWLVTVLVVRPARRGGY